MLLMMMVKYKLIAAVMNTKSQGYSKILNLFKGLSLIGSPKIITPSSFSLLFMTKILEVLNFHPTQKVRTRRICVYLIKG